jgi:Protein of unknown function (DUF4197)
MRLRSLAVAMFLLASSASASAQIQDLAKKLGLGGQSTLSDSKIASGLKQALQVGATNAVKSAGRHDGYFGNAAIKILMPRNLHPLETGLRAVGYGPKIDDFVLSMNRAAEAAAPSAKKIFLDAILAMSFDDARKILAGGDTAATDYFRSRTTAQLTTAFRPYVEKTMAQNGVARQYETLTAQYKSLPFARNQTLDINDYVVSKALDGLFYTLGQEERKIRQDPAARTTTLLKEVFANTR